MEGEAFRERVYVRRGLGGGVSERGRSPRGGVSGEGGRVSRAGCRRWAGPGAAEVGGGVSEGPAGSAVSPSAESPRAVAAFTPERPERCGEMRDGGAGLALLASLLWVSAQGQQRGEPGSPGGGGLRDKAPRLAAPRSVHASAFTPGRGSETWVSRAAPGKVAGQAGEGWGRTPDGCGPLLGASGS